VHVEPGKAVSVTFSGYVAQQPRQDRFYGAQGFRGMIPGFGGFRGVAACAGRS